MTTKNQSPATAQPSPAGAPTAQPNPIDAKAPNAVRVEDIPFPNDEDINVYDFPELRPR